MGYSAYIIFRHQMPRLLDKKKYEKQIALKYEQVNPIR